MTEEIAADAAVFISSIDPTKFDVAAATIIESKFSSIHCRNHKRGRVFSAAASLYNRARKVPGEPALIVRTASAALMGRTASRTSDKVGIIR